MNVASLLKQPLLHFLALGLALFWLFDLVADDESVDDSVIVVDRPALLTFIQYRSRSFDPGVAAARLEALSPLERELLIADFVREEALHRRALELGMEADDYIIKRRLVQKLEFVTNSFVGEGLQATEEDVAAYYAENVDDYYVPPSATFTHVFFDKERHAPEELSRLARAKLVELNESGADFSSSVRHGDRFLYHVNYVERDPELVASHFGSSMSGHVFDLEPNDQRWRGPFESPFGLHLVMLTRREAGRTPPLEEIRPRVDSDALRWLERQHGDAAVQSIVDGYEVRLDFEDEVPPGVGGVP
tara:strand:+ start:7141 stop:8052 length:912 start_codon:yes stop_codon:yes gene_type:complete